MHGKRGVHTSCVQHGMRGVHIPFVWHRLCGVRTSWLGAHHVWALTPGTVMRHNVQTSGGQYTLPTRGYPPRSQFEGLDSLE